MRKSIILAIALLTICILSGSALADAVLTTSETDGSTINTIDLTCTANLTYPTTEYESTMFLIAHGDAYVKLPTYISSSHDSKIIIYFSLNDLGTNDPVIMGYVNDILGNKFTVTIENSDILKINSNDKITQFENIEKSTVHKLVITNDTVELDGVSQELLGGLPLGGLTPYLCAINKDNTDVIYSDNSSISIWNVQIFSDGLIDCNLVPTKNVINERAVFYDTMNDNVMETFSIPVATNAYFISGTSGLSVYEFQERIDGNWTTISESVTDNTTSVSIVDEEDTEHQYRCLVAGYALISNIACYESTVPLSIKLSTLKMQAVQNESVNFGASVSGNAVDYLWEFGDGTSSTEMTPTHTYTSAGTYNYTLTVASPTSTTTTSGTVTVDSKTMWNNINQRMDLNSSTTIGILIVVTLAIAGLFVFAVVKNGGTISMPLLMAFILLIAVIYIIILVGGTFSSIGAVRFGS